ncbi:cupin domain-containing protein [Thioclava sp. BHET1]|nr:cupin domain-containing protein [Thioclava sp. BHET1]
MPHFMPVDTAPSFAPREDSALPERLIEGAPAFKTWELDTALAEATRWGTIRTGIWEATPGTTKSIKGETFEFCHILSGRCIITEDGGDSHSFGAGDSFVLKPGFVGTWKTLETLRKIFVIAS